MIDIDVIVGGGGVAGIAAAAAMQQLGYRVMVIEPGLNDARRLAGEVFHPPGVMGLEELGLRHGLLEPPSVSVKGFNVVLDDDCINLPYEAVHTHRTEGLCLEHGLIRERMLASIAAFPNVVLNRGARVVSIDQSSPAWIVVEVVRKDQEPTSYRCRMLIVADGAPSHLAQLAGIGVHNRSISTIWGYRIGSENLPERDCCHVFLGADAPILLYPIGRGQLRVLFDVPHQGSRRTTAADCLAMASVLPAMLREEVEHAITTQPRTAMITRAFTVERSTRGRVVLVGDAGGTCHPLTASGMTMCISDALLLRRTMLERADDIPGALRLYQRRRRWPQATRLLLAQELRDALCATSPELKAVRSGILAYWRHSASGRAETLALLSTADGRPLALLRQFMTVMVLGFATGRTAPSEHVRSFAVAGKLMARLFRIIRQLVLRRSIPTAPRILSDLPVSKAQARSGTAPSGNRDPNPSHSAVCRNHDRAVHGARAK